MTSNRLDVVSIAGARPNFMKIAPLAHAFAGVPSLRHRVIHTGQHYDRAMSDSFFEQLQIPHPWCNLEVGSGSHAQQTAQVMMRFEEAILRDRPDLVLVVGDVNSTIACALVAVKLGIRVAHVEAGLRSFDRSMPEEINRILTDAISDVLYVSEPAGVTNLRREGIPDERIVLAGTVMIDTLTSCLERSRSSDVLTRLGLPEKGYGVVTLHRPSNVDDPKRLPRIVAALQELSAELPLVFPVHPRTRARLSELGLLTPATSDIRFLEPQGYLDFLRLMERSRLILTDSGGIQEEACILAVPCLTLRTNTERPITIDVGMNRLVGNDPEAIVGEATRVLAEGIRPGNRPELWDGRAAERIVADLVTRYGRSLETPSAG